MALATAPPIQPCPSSYLLSPCTRTYNLRSHSSSSVASLPTVLHESLYHVSSSSQSISFCPLTLNAISSSTFLTFLSKPSNNNKSRPTLFFKRPCGYLPCLQNRTTSTCKSTFPIHQSLTSTVQSFQNSPSKKSTLSRTLIAQVQPKGETVEEAEAEAETREKEGVAAMTAGIVANELSAEAIQAAIAGADSAEEAVGTSMDGESFISEELKAIYATAREWQWKDYSITYTVQGTGPPVLLVHGFGASIGHWRRNIGVLSESNTVYAIDLLGLGASDKPLKFQYTMETWADQLVDFIKEVVAEPTVLVGNSIGSLACLIASAEAAPSKLVRGTVLLNCAGGMNNKAVTDDWRLKLLLPLLWLIDFILQQPSIATRLFNRVKSRDNLKNVLRSVYTNKKAVDDELVEVILRPADTAGALDAFVSIITGPPGPKPMSLIPSINNPILVLWGDEDPFTPINGPVGKYFQALPETNNQVELYLLNGVGHCPHDDRPDLVHNKLLPWLANLPALN